MWVHAASAPQNYTPTGYYQFHIHPVSRVAGCKASYAGLDVALAAAILAITTMEMSPVPGLPMETEDIADHEEHHGNTSLPSQSNPTIEGNVLKLRSLVFDLGSLLFLLQTWYCGESLTHTLLHIFTLFHAHH